MLRQLLEVFNVIFLPYSLILVVVPHVVKVCLDLLLELEFDWASIIEVLHHAEELGQSISIIQVFVQFLEGS